MAEVSRQLIDSRNWHRLPCRFPDLARDPHLRRAIRWALERVRRDLVGVGGRDPIARVLDEKVRFLLIGLADVVASAPRSGDLQRRLRQGLGLPGAMRSGIEALGWVVDERGLGGGRELDGLSWRLPLDVLWERYVESVVRGEIAKEGGEVLVGVARSDHHPDPLVTAGSTSTGAPGARYSHSAWTVATNRGRQVQSTPCGFGRGRVASGLRGA